MRRFRISGVDRESGMDTQFLLDADSTANAKVKAELKGTAVTLVEEYRGGLFCAVWPAPAPPAAPPTPEVTARPTANRAGESWTNPTRIAATPMWCKLMTLAGVALIFLGLPLAAASPGVGAAFFVIGLLTAIVGRMSGWLISG